MTGDVHQVSLQSAVMGVYVAFNAIHHGATVAEINPQADKRVLAAELLAELMHQRQKRKGPSGRPYMHHPRMVWYLVWQAGGTVEQQILALLHDVIEDGHKTWPNKTRADLYTDVLGFFGKELADKLMCFSNPTTLDDPSLSPEQKHQMKVDFQMQMLSDNPDLRLIKLADKVANGYDTIFDRPKGWSDEKLAEQFAFADQMLATFGDEVPEFFKAIQAALKREI
ncbi:MAG: HD domain-containing protein [Proteobacteria bacterium]|nr:HD domain-containing protein [Pseudomonadota bacterium]